MCGNSDWKKVKGDFWGVNHGPRGSLCDYTVKEWRSGEKFTT